MDFFLSWWDRLVRSVFWKSLTSDLHAFDFVFLIILFLGMMLGAKKGFAAMAAEFLALCGVTFLAVELNDPVSAILEKYAAFSPSMGRMISLILLGFGLWFLIRHVLNFLKRFVQTQLPAGIKVTGGMLIGIFYAALAWGFLSQILISLPMASMQAPYSEGGSVTGPYVIQLPSLVHQWMKDPGLHIKK